MQELRTATDLALRATKVTARSLGKAMSTMVVQERHLWHAFSMPPSPRLGCSATLSRALPSSSRQCRSRPRRSSTSCHGRMHRQLRLPLGPGLRLLVAVDALLRPPELLRPVLKRQLGRRVEPLAGVRRPPRPIRAPSRPGNRRSGPDASNPEMLEFALSQETTRTASLLPPCLLSCFDPSPTRTVPTVCVRRSGVAVQGPPLRALPLSPCLHEGRRGHPCPVMGSGRQDPQLSRRLAHSGPVPRTVVRSQGSGASAPQPVGASGQLGKEQALPCAENLFSWCGVRLGEYDGAPHRRACPISAELPEFLQRQDCGSTETVSEAPGAYGIRSWSHATRIASYETTSALVALPNPEVGMVPRCTSGEHHTGVSPLIQPLDGPCLSTGRGSLRTSVSACCCHNRCLQHGLGRYMQRAGSLGALDGASTALAHQLPRAAGSASSLAAVSATAVRQACVGPYRQHCGCVVYQPDGGYTITPHVTARPPSPPLESHAAQIAVRCPQLNRAADALSRQLTFPGEWRLHPETIRLIWSRFREAQVDLFASRESSHCQLYFSLTEGTLGTDALAHSWPRALCKYAFPPVSLLTQTL